MRNVSDKSWSETQNTHFKINFFFSENGDVFEIMCKNNAEPDRPQLTIRRMRIACSIPKGRVTHSEYVILTDFPLQQLLYERASRLRYTYIACLV